MASCDEPQLLPVAEALARKQERVRTITRTESVALPKALDRILSTAISAPLNVL